MTVHVQGPDGGFDIKSVFVPPHDDVLDSDRPGGEAARFCWRTLEQKKNCCFLVVFLNRML